MVLLTLMACSLGFCGGRFLCRCLLGSVGIEVEQQVGRCTVITECASVKFLLAVDVALIAVDVFAFKAVGAVTTALSMFY